VTPAALAEEPPPAPPEGAAARPTKAILEVTVGGDSAGLDLQLRPGAFPELGDLTLRLRQVPSLTAGEVLEPTEEPSLVARCWMDATRPGELTLYFTDRRAERFLVRRLVVSRPPDEIDREMVAQVFELSLSALLEGHDTGPSRAQIARLLGAQSTPATPELPPSPPERTPPAELTFGVALGYRVSEHSSRLGMVQGPQVNVDVTSAWEEAALGAEVSLSRELEARLVREDFALTLSSWQLRLGPFGERRLAPTWWGRLGATVGLDAIALHPELTAEVSKASAEGDDWTNAWTLGLWGALAWRPASRGTLELRVGLEFDPARLDYVLGTPEGQELFLRRRRVRPTCSVLLGF